jgi:hypothetical protein
MNLKTFVVGALAVILMTLYVFTFYMAVRTSFECYTPVENTAEKTARINAVSPAANSKCSPERSNLEGGVSIIFAGVGGIISAFAIGILTVTEPNKLPTNALTGPELSGFQLKAAKGISVAFVLIWLLGGAVAVIVGLLLHNGTIPPLTEMAKAWIGTAIAAVGAYWGYQPK